MFTNTSAASGRFDSWLLGVACSALLMSVGECYGDNIQNNDELMQWTAVGGVHSIEAAFEGIEDDKVKLRRKDGSTAEVPIDKLDVPSQKCAKFLANGGSDAVRSLVGEDQHERHDAARSLLALADLPAPLLPLVLRFIDLEVAELVRAQPRGKASQRVSELPAMTDETPLVRVEADSLSHVGKSFTIVGGVSSSSYFNYGYDDAEGTHFSLKFDELNENAESTGMRASLYVSRSFSSLLIERMTRVQEAGSSALAVRVKVRLDAERYEGASSWDLLEVEDWQFLDSENERWTTWALGGLRLGAVLVASFRDVDALLAIMTRPIPFGTETSDLLLRQMAGSQLNSLEIQRTDVSRLIEAIAADGAYGNEEADSLVRMSAIGALKRADKAGRRIALKELRNLRGRARRDGNNSAEQWTTLAGNAVLAADQ